MGCSTSLSVRTPGTLESVYRAELSFGGQIRVCDQTRVDLWACKMERHPDGSLTFTFGYNGDPPVDVEVVLRDQRGEQLLAATVSPNHDETRPNGKNCDPVCHVSTVTL